MYVCRNIHIYVRISYLFIVLDNMYVYTYKHKLGCLFELLKTGIVPVDISTDDFGKKSKKPDAIIYY